MKPVTLIAFVLTVILLCSCCRGYCIETCISCHHNAHVHYAQPYLPKGKYVGTPVRYYANSEATFQSLLLISGDINPNPGPDSGRLGLSAIDNSPNSRYLYDTQTLRSLNSSHISRSWCNDNPTVWNRIVSLGINRGRKTLGEKEVFIFALIII